MRFHECIHERGQIWSLPNSTAYLVRSMQHIPRAEDDERHQEEKRGPRDDEAHAQSSPHVLLLIPEQFWEQLPQFPAKVYGDLLDDPSMRPMAWKRSFGRDRLYPSCPGVCCRQGGLIDDFLR
jgi:hypothetical protein